MSTAVDLPVAEMTAEQLLELAIPEFDPNYRLPVEQYGVGWVDSQAPTILNERE